MCTDCQDLQKNVKYLEFFGFVEKFNIQNCVNCTGNCVHFVYRLYRFAKNLKFQNCVNSTGNCVH